LNVKRVGTLVAGIAVVALTAGHGSQPVDKPSEADHSSIRLAEAPKRIYSDNPNDSWNRIFYYLFSRRVTACLSADFPEAAPFEKAVETGFMHLERSTRTFERDESGDRAIDPLYPSFLSDAGIRVVLKGPAYAGFKKALEDGLAETPTRSAIARALMQSDLWSAYDIFFRYQHYEQQGEHELAQHRLELLDLLGRLMRKVALTPDEIRTLPDNYAMKKAKYPLPDLFGDAGWVEVKWFPYRLHDASVDYRRVTRVFLRPRRRPKDMRKFLNDFRREERDAVGQLDGVALVIQPLVVDTHGDLEPAKIVTDLQMRVFQDETIEKTRIEVYEVSRRLLREAGSGFLVEEAEDEAVYFPSAGNDYSYASANEMGGGLAFVVKQRTRCTMCHGHHLTGLMTFAMAVPPKEGLGPPVRQLNPAAHEAANFVMLKKMEREDWKRLRQYFPK
jgi:hypothetical protein